MPEPESQTAEPMVVWGIGTSRTLRVHWLAAELGLSYEVKPVQARTGETQTAQYLSMSPKGKVPVLVHGSLVLTESAAILAYLSDVFAPEQGFFVPKNAIERGQLSEWCFYVMTELDAHALYILRRHESLSAIYGEAPEAAASAREYFQRLIRAAELKIEKADPYLFGRDLSIADILLTTVLSWAHAYGLQLTGALLDYRHTVRQRPAYIQAVKLNYPEPGQAASAGA